MSGQPPPAPGAEQHGADDSERSAAAATDGTPVQGSQPSPAPPMPLPTATLPPQLLPPGPNEALTPSTLGQGLAAPLVQAGQPATAHAQGGPGFSPQHQPHMQLAPPLPRRPAQQYPPAQATHQQVVESPDVFRTALQRMHSVLGAPEKVPKVGGRPLDLHTLYCSVTALGGCESVIVNKQWRDAAKPFGFADTITAVSFNLRKAYLAFLWDFEQVYFFRRSGPRVPAPATHRSEAVGGGEGNESGSPKPAAAKRQQNPRSGSPGQVPSAAGGFAAAVAAATQPPQLIAHAAGQGPATRLAVGARGTVRLDSRIDAGFFCTVTVAGHVFRGLLYYQPQADHGQQPPAQQPPLTQPQLLPRLPPATLPLPFPGAPAGSPAMGVGVPAVFPPAMSAEAAKPHRKHKRKRDPEEPKPNKLPFNYFSIDARPRARAAHPELSTADISKKVGEMWQGAGPEERAPYVALSNADKERYQAEQVAYSKRLGEQQAALSPVGGAQPEAHNLEAQHDPQAQHDADEGSPAAMDATISLDDLAHSPPPEQAVQQEPLAQAALDAQQQQQPQTDGEPPNPAAQALEPAAALQQDAPQEPVQAAAPEGASL